jgi:hypothetical protein
VRICGQLTEEMGKVESSVSGDLFITGNQLSFSMSQTSVSQCEPWESQKWTRCHTGVCSPHIFRCHLILQMTSMIFLFLCLYYRMAEHKEYGYKRVLKVWAISKKITQQKHAMGLLRYMGRIISHCPQKGNLTSESMQPHSRWRKRQAETGSIPQRMRTEPV